MIMDILNWIIEADPFWRGLFILICLGIFAEIIVEIVRAICGRRK